MARVKGGLMTSVLDVSKHLPLDSRELVTKYDDLINPQIWKVNTLETDGLYNGLRVSVSENTENRGIYMLLDRKAITSENYENYLAAKENNEDTDIYFSMWTKIITTQDKLILNGGNANG